MTNRQRPEDRQEMTREQLRALVREALDRAEIMALSTVDADSGTWTSPVQYQWGPGLHLFFSSMPDARHVRNMARDKRVSAAIYAFPGPPGGNLGLQISGQGQPVTNDADESGWQRFEITPAEVWLFDSRLDRQRHRVDIGSLDLPQR